MNYSRPRPAIGHMPFPGHRTQAEVRRDEARRPTAKLDRFAELLSMDLSRGAICERLGLGCRQYDKLLERLRRTVGAQAR